MLPFWKIIGWAIYVALYMMAAGGMNHWPDENLKSVCLKVLPVLQCLFIVLSSKSIEDEFPSFRKSIAYGFVLSMIGDGFLVFDEYRLYGAIAFGLAHVNFLQALGFAPFGSAPSIASFTVIGGSIVYHMLPHATKMEHVGYFLYLGLLLTVAWRTTVRYIVSANHVNLCGCLGGLLFVISDAVLLSDFLVKKWEHAPLVVMLTYYSAQLGLAMLATSDFVPTGYESKAKAA